MKRTDDLVKELLLSVPNGASKRFDCPSCSGSNTFSVTNNGNIALFMCFKASCNLKGKISKELSIEDIREFRHLVYEKEEKEVENFEIPNTWVTIESLIGRISGSAAYAYLNANNLTPYYELNPDEFLFDKIKERVVFLKRINGKVIFANGRALSRYITPKWYKYFIKKGEFFIANAEFDEFSCSYSYIREGSSRMFIVEDCASACALYSLGNSLALCGTSYNLPDLISKLTEIGSENITILLDADAQRKALQLKRDLEGGGKFKEVTVRCLSDDAKNLDFNVLKTELGY